MNEQPENISSSDQSIETPKLSLTGHKLIQEGYMIRDICSPSRPNCYSGAFSIPHGKMLINENGGYDIVDETRSQ